MSPLYPSASPRNTGFHSLKDSTSSNAGMAGDAIPLRSVRTNSTSSRRQPFSALAAADLGLDGSHEKPKRGDAGRRKKLNRSSRRTTASDDVSLNAMGKIYSKIIGFSILTRMMVYVVPIGLLLAVPLIIMVGTGHRRDTYVGSDNGNNGPPLFDIFFWIEVSWLALWGSKVVAISMPVIFMFFCGVISPGTRKYASVLRALEVPLSLFGWALASWLIFKALFNGSLNASIPWVNSFHLFLGAAFTSTGVYLGEKALVQLIAISYHQRSFANRIRDSKHDIHILGILYDASRALFPMYCPEFAQADYVINDSIDIMLAGHVGTKPSTGAVTPMRLIGDVGRLGDKVTSVFGSLATEITGKKVFNPNSAHSVVVEALEKHQPSEALAKRIWMSFVVEGKDALYQDDIEEVLGPSYQLEAAEAFTAIDEDKNGDISLDEMIRKVVNIGNERRAVSEGMKDISEALMVFDSILLFVVLFLIVFIFLAFFQSSFITTLATAGTALLSLSFIFAVTTQEFLGSCIFLFVKHPYDVGDRVEISNGEKVPLVVDRISLLYTVFTRLDRMQIVQVPNIQLNNLWIENITRSKATQEFILVNVSFDTTLEDIELLRIEMENFVRSAENCRDFQSDVVVAVRGVGDLDKMELGISIKYKSGWHNEVIRASRRSKFMCALTLALKRIPIYPPGGGGQPVGAVGNPSYSVAVSDEIAACNREQAAHQKEAKRLVPTKTSTADQDEEKAASVLNWRRPSVANDDDFTVCNETQQERRRSVDIDTLRNDLKHIRSGHRKPGESLPPAAAGSVTPGLSLTRPGTHSTRARRFDEEAQTGLLPRQVANNPTTSGHVVFSTPPSSQDHPHSPPVLSENRSTSPPIVDDSMTQPLPPLAVAAAVHIAGQSWPQSVSHEHGTGLPPAHHHPSH